MYTCTHIFYICIVYIVYAVCVSHSDLHIYVYICIVYMHIHYTVYVVCVYVYIISV